uniref:IST1-like protein n=1 Tax=Anthurium amnicola TaxID=1678845 RepID=A0A1D1XGG0_9ARAE
MLSKSFKAGKCKTSLKLAVARIKLLKNKRGVQVKQMRRDLAQLLEAGQDQTARIRVEHVIREEKTMSAYDLIELYCELIVARLAIIESQKKCPIDLKEAISSVIFASPRCADIPELLDVRKHFVAKYGKEFATSALELRPDCGVNRLVVEKLSAKAPDIETKIKVLTAIAQEHDIKWDPSASEEQIQNPPEDRLGGPNSFTSKIPVESSTVQFPPPLGQKHKPTAKSNEEDMGISSAGSNSFSPPLVDTGSQHGPRASGKTYDGSESRHSYIRDEHGSLNQQKWTMEFKDATSAAQVAAESAERASMAARAAAELASRGNDSEFSSRSREPSMYGSKRDTGNFMGSKLQGESLSRDSINRDHNINEATYARNPRMQSGLEAEGMQEHITRDSETSSSRYGGVVSSPSRHRSSEEDAIVLNQRSKKIGKDDSPGEESAERHPIRPISNSNNHSHDRDVSISNLQKSDSYAPERFLKEDPVQNLSEGADRADATRGGIEMKTSKSLSSRSGASNIDHETIWDSPSHKNYVNQQSLGSAEREINLDGHEHGFNDNASVVFDRSDSDNDDHLEIESHMEMHDHDPNFRQPEANIHISSSKMDYLVPDQQQSSGFHVKDGSHSSLLSVSRVQPAELSGTVRGYNTPSQSNTATYDASDGPSSDSDDEMGKFTGRGDTDLDSLQGKRNVGKYEHPQSLSKSLLVDMEPMDRLDQSSVSFTAADAKPDSSYVGEHELNFGRLTGGLKNKGYLRPPYVKNPMVDEPLASEISTNDSLEKPVAPSRDMTARNEDANKDIHNRKSHFRKNKDSVSGSQNSYDSDNIETEHLEQQPAFGSSVCGSVASLTSKLDDSLTVDNKQKVSGTFMRSESNELIQEAPYQRSIGRASKERSGTSAAACIDKNTEKQSLSPARSRHFTGASASIPSNHKVDNTKTTTSNTGKTAGHTDSSEKKLLGKTYEGSRSATIPFFDEENDEDEVLQPRRTFGNLGIRGGRVSQRTRGTKVGQPSNVTGSPHDSSGEGKTSDLERKPFEESCSTSETPFKPSTRSAKPENNRNSKFAPPNLVMEWQHEQISGAEALVQKDGLEASQSSLSGSNLSQSDSMQTNTSASNKDMKPSTLGGGKPSRENSLKGSHVHPKLPDYESLAAHFHSLRSNRR